MSGINLDSFRMLAAGKYNLGSVVIKGEGTENAHLEKINNHRWIGSNKTVVSAEENKAVREALYSAIKSEINRAFGNTNEDANAYLRTLRYKLLGGDNASKALTRSGALADAINSLDKMLDTAKPIGQRTVTALDAAKLGGRSYIGAQANQQAIAALKPEVKLALEVLQNSAKTIPSLNHEQQYDANGLVRLLRALERTPDMGTISTSFGGVDFDLSINKDGTISFKAEGATVHTGVKVDVIVRDLELAIVKLGNELSIDVLNFADQSAKLSGKVEDAAHVRELASSIITGKYPKISTTLLQGLTTSELVKDAEIIAGFSPVTFVSEEALIKYFEDMTKPLEVSNQNTIKLLDQMDIMAEKGVKIDSKVKLEYLENKKPAGDPDKQKVKNFLADLILNIDTRKTDKNLSADKNGPLFTENRLKETVKDHLGILTILVDVKRNGILFEMLDDKMAEKLKPLTDKDTTGKLFTLGLRSMFSSDDEIYKEPAEMIFGADSKVPLEDQIKFVKALSRAGYVAEEDKDGVANAMAALLRDGLDETAIDNLVDKVMDKFAEGVGGLFDVNQADDKGSKKIYTKPIKQEVVNATVAKCPALVKGIGLILSEKGTAAGSLKNEFMTKVMMPLGLELVALGRNDANDTLSKFSHAKNFTSLQNHLEEVAMVLSELPERATDGSDFLQKINAIAEEVVASMPPPDKSNAAETAIHDFMSASADKLLVAVKLYELKNKTLEQIEEGSDDSGIQKFTKDALAAYFKKENISKIDRRAMVAALVRYGGDINLAKMDNISEDDQYRIFGAMMKGAGPIMQKMLQGFPLPANASQAMKDAFNSLKDEIPPIPDNIVKAQLLGIVERSGGKITSIEAKKVLGSASVGEALLCTIKTPDNPAGTECVVKLLRSDVQNRLEREKKIFIDAAKLTPGMEKTFEGQLERIVAELDLRSEADFVKAGKIYDGTFNNVKAMKLNEAAGATMDTMVVEKAPGDTLKRVMDNLSKEIDEIANRKTGDLASDITAMKELQKKLINHGKSLASLANKWVTEGLFNSGFYHGDLHAGNIMIDENSNITVIDFGNATQLPVEQRKMVMQMVAGANYGEADTFLEGFIPLLSEQGKSTYNARKEEIDEIVKIIVSKGDSEKAGERIMALIQELQKVGLEIPPQLYNFSQCQIRLSNAMNDLIALVNKCNKAYGTMMDNRPEMGSPLHMAGIKLPVKEAFYRFMNDNDLKGFKSTFEGGKQEGSKKIDTEKRQDNLVAFTKILNTSRNQLSKIRSHIENRGSDPKIEEELRTLLFTSNFSDAVKNINDGKEVDENGNIATGMYQRRLAVYAQKDPEFAQMLKDFDPVSFIDVAEMKLNYTDPAKQRFLLKLIDLESDQLTQMEQLAKDTVKRDPADSFYDVMGDVLKSKKWATVQMLGFGSAVKYGIKEIFA